LSEQIGRHSFAGARRGGLGQSTRTRFLLIVTVLSLALLAMCGVTIVDGQWHKRQLAFARQQAVSIVQDLGPLQDTIREIQVDVIQVQQFLTDASATHKAEPFAEADRHSKHFYDEVKTVREILTRIEAQDGIASVAEVRRKIDQTVDAFQGYREHGETMARLYIDRGIPLGNDFMSVFDTTAELLYVQLDGALDNLRRLGDTKSQAALAALRGMEEAIATANLLAMLLGGLGIVAGGLVFLLLGPAEDER
jgi:methyl-accepting chemotaxis protein